MPDPLPPAQHGARAPRSARRRPARRRPPPPRWRGGTPPSPRPPWLSPACSVWQIVTARGGTPDPTDDPAPRPWRRRRRQRDPRLPRGPRVHPRPRGHHRGAQRRPPHATAGRSRPARASGRPHRSRRGSSSSRRSAPSARASLDVQAATGLLAVVVLLVVMNWFFHRIYWTGWISSHNRRRRRLLVEVGPRDRRRILLGLALLGFTCGLPRGLRDRPLPAEPAAAVRVGGRAPRALPSGSR